MAEKVKKIKTSYSVNAEHIFRLLFRLLKISISYYAHIVKFGLVRRVGKEAKLSARMFHHQRRQKTRLRIMQTILQKILRPQQKTVTRNLLIILLLIVICYQLGYLDTISNLLDSAAWTLNIGNIGISLFTVIETVIWLIFLLWLANQLSQFIKNRLDWFVNIDVGLRTLIHKIAQIIIYIILFLLMSKILGINLTSLAWFSGALGIGIGFGLQKIIANFVSGLILIFERALVPGALIELEDGKAGYIRHIAMRHTLLETLDGSEILIPNEDLVNYRLTNWTLNNSEMRTVIVIAVDYDADIDFVRALMLDVVQDNKKILTHKPPDILLKDVKDKQVVLELTYWVDGVEVPCQEVRSEVLYAVRKKFKEHKINLN